ncbi:MAG TPA: hypothetical protein VFV39_05760 [Limnobacter sp.]|nr:hypothetical protein [Limnobacter sp.]
MTYTRFEDLMRDMQSMRPHQKHAHGLVFFFNDQPVRLVAGEMEGVHWMDIHIELTRFRTDTLQAAKKVLMANREMGGATPIPTWFAMNDKDQLVFINRLDWRHISAKILEEHILRCIEQMGIALQSEGV